MEPRTPEQAQDLLDEIQRAAFRMADTWAAGLNLEYAGVDLSAPMLYNLVASFNRQMEQFYFPPPPPMMAQGEPPVALAAIAEAAANGNRKERRAQEAGQRKALAKERKARKAKVAT